MTRERWLCGCVYDLVEWLYGMTWLCGCGCVYDLVEWLYGMTWLCGCGCVYDLVEWLYGMTCRCGPIHVLGISASLPQI